MGDWVSRALASVESGVTSGGGGVAALRAGIMRDGAVDAAEAARLLTLHRSEAPVTREAGWDDLFVEALTDHFALSRELPDWDEADLRPDWAAAMRRAADAIAFDALDDAPKPHSWTRDVEALGVKDSEAQMLVDALSANGLTLDRVEIRLLGALFARATQYPMALRAFAWKALAATVARDRMITDGETELVRALVMGPASCEGIAVSRVEANAILAINAACDRETRAAGWSQLFAQAIAMHVLHGSGSPGVIDADEAQWLAANVPQATPEAQALDAFLAA